MRDKLLKNLAGLAYNHPWRILGLALVITVIALALGSSLELSMHLSDLMPKSDPRTIEFNHVLEKYRSASSIMIALHGDEEEIKAYAEEAAPYIENITTNLDNGHGERLIKRVQVKIDEDFIRSHGMMLMKTRDLENAQDMFSDVNLKPLLTSINDNFEKTYIYTDDEEKLSTKEKSDNAIRYLDGLKYWLRSMEAYYNDPEISSERALTATDRLLIGEPYALSYDRHILLIAASPTFSVTDVKRSVAAADSLDTILTRVGQNYPHAEYGLTGMVAMSRDEMVAVYSDMNYLTLIALVLILILFIVSFRMWVAPVLAVLVLAIGVIWTMGFAAITVGSLNMMTAMFAVILVGLGIDFAVHIISGFVEKRGQGAGIAEAIEWTLQKAGPGITTGGMTTGIAFLTLTVSDSRGMSEFGLIAGVGIIFCMIAALTLLPPLLVIREKRRAKKSRAAVSPPVEFRFIGSAASGLARGRWAVLIVMALLTAFFAYHTSSLEFDYDMLNMEPKGMASVVWNDSLLAAFDMSPEYALVTSSSLDSIRTIVKRAKEFPNIAIVDAITEYIPADEDQAERAVIIRQIRSELESSGDSKPIRASDVDPILEQIDRLWMNVTEMSDMAFQAGQDRLERKCYELVAIPGEKDSPDVIQSLISNFGNNPSTFTAAMNRFQNDYFSYFRQTVLKMANPERYTLEDLPETITERYVSDDGGTYLVSMFPKNDIWNMENLKAFDRQLRSISPKATGTPCLFLAMIEIMGADGRRATVIAFFTILLLLFIDFRRISLTLLAAVPLLAGTIWMSGMLHLVGLKLNVSNVIAIPLILGIGIDYGVHLIHRYRIEGRGKVKEIFSSTGKAIMISAMTTMIGFGSLGFMIHRGMASMGILLFIGVGTCFLTAMGILAPMFGKKKIEDK